MHIDVAMSTLQGTSAIVRLLTTPDVCPRCYRSVQPKFITMSGNVERYFGQAVFQCTSLSCQELFLAIYASLNRLESGYAAFGLDSIAPTNVQIAKFPKTISDISPQFEIIYNQALEAESKGLDQLFGMGLRKALEFLVKDYAISEHPDKADEIRQNLLGQCIEKYVTDPNVKQCAKRAAWLGNDETHYSRKWESKDVNDLKVLVKLTVNWIESACLTKSYIADMT